MLTVPQAFLQLLIGLQPSKRDVDAARSRVSSVKAAVIRHLRAPIVRSVNLGSYQKGTGIRGHSDVDLLFVVSPKHLDWGGAPITSTSLLERFRRAISATYPTTLIGREGQSVAVRFSSSRVTLDVVPAVEAGKIKSANLYRIPDGSGAWMQVAPLAELGRFKKADARSGRKLRRAVQLLKFWKHCRADEVRIRSYYMELVLTVEGLANGPKSYSEILHDSFRVLAQRGATGIRDPDSRVGVTSAVSPRASAAKVIDALRRARDYAADAVWHEDGGDTRRALAQWRKVFNDQFPTR